jgi:hypothetical protein
VVSEGESGTQLPGTVTDIRFGRGRENGVCADRQRKRVFAKFGQGKNKQVEQLRIVEARRSGGPPPRGTIFTSIGGPRQLLYRYEQDGLNHAKTIRALEKCWAARWCRIPPVCRYP